MVLLEQNRSNPAADGSFEASSARALVVVRSRLDAGWCILRGRRLAAGGESCAVNAIVMHPTHGIALINVTQVEYSAPEIAVRVVRAFLNERGLQAQFSGYLPIVFVTTDPAAPQDAPKRLAAAFAAITPLGIKDPMRVDGDEAR